MMIQNALTFVMKYTLAARPVRVAMRPQNIVTTFRQSEQSHFYQRIDQILIVNHPHGCKHLDVIR